MGSTHEPAPVESDATVISSRPPGGPMSMVEIGRALEGTRLGPYQLEQFVGGGGMGAVFRALDTTLDRIVAVKVLSRQQSADEEMLKRFRNEAQSAARLDHENIGRVHAVGSEDGWHFIVFEFIEGTNLRDVVKESGPFDAGRAINVAIQVADALEHASERDVVHRDIKPSNIIITPAGRARLVDMGLARLHHVGAEQDLTISGMTLGTFDYISPEQARDPRSADVRSDLYSLGCTIFYTLVGRAPFAEGTMVQKLLQHQQEVPPPIDSLRPDVPARFSAAVARLMEKAPEDRYQRPAELIADLLSIADECGIDVAASRSATVAVAEALVEPEKARSASRLPWLVPLLGLAATVAALWWASPRPPGPAGQQAGAGLLPGGGAASATVGSGAANEPRVWQVVESPSGERQRASLGEAIRAAGDGDVVELAFDGVRDEPPLAIEGIRVRVRPAAGRTPTVRFIAGQKEAGLSGAGLLVTEQAASAAACTISAGALSISDVRLTLGRGFGSSGAIFCLRHAAALDCENVVLRLPGAVSVSDSWSEYHAAFVRVGGHEDAHGGRRQPCEVRMTGCSVAGEGVFLESLDGGDLDVFWTGGTCVVARQFLSAEGAPRSVGAGPAIRLSLKEGLLACREGFASLRDSPARPLVPHLNAFAEGCRFVTPEGRPLLEQSGIEEPDSYRPRIEWLDANSRYEGSSVFRRIDGSAERVEIDFAAFPQPLIHSARILPEVKAWTDGGDDAGEPDSVGQ